MEMKHEETKGLYKMEEAIKAHIAAASSTNRDIELELELYALHKQATEGDLKSPDPGTSDSDAHAKWQAWKNRTGTTKEAALRSYNELLKKSLPKSVFS